MKELLFSITKKDLQITFFSGTGAGGQYRNKHQNCVRLVHPESGAISTGQSNRNRQANIKEALEGLTKRAKFKVWHNRKVYEVITKKTIEDLVDDLMQESNLKVEYKNKDGQWTSIPN
jgi:protein subunit release factor B